MKSNRRKKEEESNIFKSGLSVVEPEIYLDHKLDELLKEIVKQKGTDDELSVLFKGEWDDYYKGFVVSLDYYIPIQEVGGASVDYHKSYFTKIDRDKALEAFKKEGLDVSTGQDKDGVPHVKENLYKLRSQGYNTIVHSHPFNKVACKFSSADKEFINSHFPCSILLDKTGEVVMGSLLMPTDSKKLKVRVETEEIIRLVAREAWDIKGLDKIHKKQKRIIQESTISKELPKGVQKVFNGVLVRSDTDRDCDNIKALKEMLLQCDGEYAESNEGLMDIGDDKYLGNGLWESDIESEIKRLVKEDGYDEDIVRGWFSHYTDSKKIAGLLT